MNSKTFTAVLVGAIALGVVVISLSWGQPANDALRGGNGIGVTGPEFTYLEDGALYQSKPGDPNEKANRKKVAERVNSIQDEKGSKVLFVKESGKLRLPAEGPTWPDFWIADTVSGTAEKIYDGVSTADMSPLGDMIAVSTNAYGFHLITFEGEFIKKIGIHGTDPLFSPDGNLLAYIKLNDGAVEMGDEMVQGLAVYDVKTGRDALIVKMVKTVKNTAGFDFTIPEGPYDATHWSRDSKRMSFISSFNPISEGKNALEEKNALWSVSADGTDPRQLKVEDFVLYSPQLFSADGLIVIAEEYGMGRETDVNISAYRFNYNGDLVSQKRLAKGSSPQWLEQDRLIAYRTPDKRWEVLDLTR